MSHEPALPTGAIGVEAVAMTMRFGDFTALDDVTLNVRPGTFHALLGENGAGKSTLVKCIMGFYHATQGGLLVDGHEARVRDPVDAQRLGLGMVYQHFTLVPSLTGAENLLISRADAPAVISWRQERAALAAFLDQMPFKVPLDRPVSTLAAGEKQKLEILKQLYLGSRFLILDEPTSVLTPAEADEVLGHVRALCEAGQISVLMITHKFREVTQFADDVSVLRRGRLAGSGRVADLGQDDMARMMMGGQPEGRDTQRTETDGAVVLSLEGATARDRSGLKSIQIDALQVKAGEILGIAGVSGNGQTELMEMLTGQRKLTGGAIRVKDTDYGATRREAAALQVRYLPEEPLQNACAPTMSVAENLAFRLFDTGQGARPKFWKNTRQMIENAHDRIAEFKVKTTSAHSPISALSGGNVQRAVLARELTGDVDLLIVANPCFGLDFAAVAAIRERILNARNHGVAVLLISEDLDEILELSDRILVMSEGKIAFETTAAQADTAQIGTYMAGHA
jgi:simple sugar transport system ATP-binding protein